MTHHHLVVGPLLMLFLVQYPVLSRGAVTTSSSPTAVDYGADPTGRTDSTQAIKRYAAAHPSGQLLFPTGQYKVTSVISFGRQQTVEGMQASGSVIDCSAVTAGPCIIFGDTKLSGADAVPLGGAANIMIQGPQSSESSVGIFLGGDPYGTPLAQSLYANGLTFRQVRICGFGTGIKWGNNAWNESFINAGITGNGVGIEFAAGIANSGESETFTGGTISNNGTGIVDDGGGLFLLLGTSVDYNTTALGGSWENYVITGCHLEQSVGPIVTVAGNSGYESVYDSYGSRYALTASSGNDQSIITVANTYTHVSVSGGAAFAYHPVTYMINAVSGTQFSQPSSLPYLQSHIGAYWNLPQNTQSNGNSSLSATTDPANPIVSSSLGGNASLNLIRSSSGGVAGYQVSTGSENLAKWQTGFCPAGFTDTDTFCLFNYPLAFPALVADSTTNYIGVGRRETPPALLSVGNNAQFQVNTTGQMIASSVQPRGYTFNNLPVDTGDGTLVYCTDCKNQADDKTGGFDSVAAPGGHGSLVLHRNNAWLVH